MPRSNQTKHLLAQSLQELMATTPLEKISVNDIVDHAGVGRNTFYYHFEDKYDLVNWYFQSGITQFLVERSAYSSWDSLLTALEAYFLENKVFYCNALAYNGQNSLQQYMFDYLRSIFEQNVRELSPDASAEDTRKIGQFFAGAMMGILIPWVLSGMKSNALSNMSELSIPVFNHEIMQKLLRGGDTLIAQGLVSGVLLWVGWRCGLAGWNVWGLGIAASCYSLFYLGTVLRCTTRSDVKPLHRAGLAAAAFVLLAVLGQFGSVGLAGNGYPGPIFLLAASLAGWVLVRQAACLAAAWPKFSTVLAYLGRATMPIVILHFLSFKLVTWLGLLATGGEPYLLAAFPTYFTGGLWWLAYTVVGLALPLAGDWVYKKVREAFPLGGRWPKAG